MNLSNCTLYKYFVHLSTYIPMKEDRRSTEQQNQVAICYLPGGPNLLINQFLLKNNNIKNYQK